MASLLRSFFSFIRKTKWLSQLIALGKHKWHKLWEKEQFLISPIELV